MELRQADCDGTGAGLGRRGGMMGGRGQGRGGQGRGGQGIRMMNGSCTATGI